ncbi:MAG: hypothetical protein ACYDBP_07195 [Leptospirales bacterium]
MNEHLDLVVTALTPDMIELEGLSQTGNPVRIEYRREYFEDDHEFDSMVDILKSRYGWKAFAKAKLDNFFAAIKSSA